MKLKNIAILFLFVSFPSTGYELCKSKKLSESETLICKNHNLRSLDIKLNELYSAAYKAEKENNLLKRDQLNWLKEYRNKCKSEDCLQRQYEDRVLYLLNKIESSKKINESLLEENQYSEICNKVAELAENLNLSEHAIIGVGINAIKNSNEKSWIITDEEKSLEHEKGLYSGAKEIFNIKVSNNGPFKKYIKYFTGGTCSSYTIYSSDYILSPEQRDGGRISVDDPEEEIRWAYWGGNEFPIYYKERNFIITGSLSKPALISLIQPDGKILPLCLLEESSNKLTVDSSQNKELCAGVANNSIRPEKWINANDQIHINGETNYRNKFTELYGEYAEGVELLASEIKIGKESWSIAKMTYDSGAGCGSHQEWLRKAVLNSDPLKLYPKDSTLDEANAENINVYKNNGKYYVGVFSRASPSYLYEIGTGNMVQECTFGKSVSSKIKRIF